MPASKGDYANGMSAGKFQGRVLGKLDNIDLRFKNFETKLDNAISVSNENEKRLDSVENELAVLKKANEMVVQAGERKLKKSTYGWMIAGILISAFLGAAAIFVSIFF